MDADHVGGNDKLARAGLSILPGAVVAGAGLDDDVLSNFGRASVLAHENVLARMSAPTGQQSPVAIRALADEDVRLPDRTRCT